MSANKSLNYLDSQNTPPTTPTEEILDKRQFFHWWHFSHFKQSQKQLDNFSLKHIMQFFKKIRCYQWLMGIQIDEEPSKLLTF